MSLANLTALRNGALAGARALSLAGCGLTAFPSEIFSLSDTLEVLDLGFNALSGLPDDLSRLRRLRVLFCSGNRFERLPPALGDCAALSQIGFRGTGMRDVPSEALPRHLRWLTLTDNRIETLPEALGQRPCLRKLMLSGNRLRALPESLADAPALELLRIAANRFDALPSWLHRHPTLAWVGWAGNHFDRIAAPVARPVPWQDLDIGTVLGQGASGVVHQAVWRRPPMADRQAVAVKLFKGAMTSDGLPRHEMAACLAAGGHPHLVGALGRLSGHPEGQDGLVMPLIPAHWRVLAGPPSLESCTRDVYDPGFRLTPSAAIRIAHRMAQALAHMHGRGLLHGDLYAHNILWDGSRGDAVLSDFGAACFLPDASDGRLMGIEVRAFGLLIGELLAASAENADDTTCLSDIQGQCLQPEVTQRPMMAGIVDALARADRD
ncbi:MAG: leucine-rich repeat-containing serine/threonine-protein kinase [Sphingopyxis sp.]|nr:leucine-rich repeat-containing serine/threonine-protein kinase [Sphingopyxis sp.]